MKNVSFIPAQMDGVASTSTEAARDNPLRLLVRDAGVLFTNLPYLPWIILPFKTSDPSAELYLGKSNTRDTVVQVWLLFLETILLLLAIPSILVLPGGISVLAACLCCAMIQAICLPLQGSRIVHSTMDSKTVKAAKQHQDERWIFINGCMTGHVGLQSNCNRLARTFGRPVVGIHNQTNGLVADLMECLLQRCLSFTTKDCRIAYDYVKACLTDPTVAKVVLVGHSQGGIIASTVLDKLFSDLPTDTISKLEVYTFGSAASHFNNPMRTLSPTATSNLNRCIPHIEHYCNELDMITRWGVLYNVTATPDNRYCGKVFIRSGASGHMFNQHYLDPMFPLDKTRSNENGFLDQVVDVDEETANKRESVSVQQAGMMRCESSLENFGFGDGTVGARARGSKTPTDGAANAALGIDFVEQANSRTGVTQARGKTVRELSRLWRYMGGASPSPSSSPGPAKVESLNRICNDMVLASVGEGVER